MCERHGVFKSEHYYHLCRTRPDYFAQWEAGCGLGQDARAGGCQAKRRALEARNAPMPAAKPELKGGPGTELHAMLSWFGINAGKCKCKQRAALMDKWGPDVCLEKISTIVGWLQEEAEKREMPFSFTMARWLVKKAIKRARKKAERQVSS